MRSRTLHQESTLPQPPDVRLIGLLTRRFDISQQLIMRLKGNNHTGSCWVKQWNEPSPQIKSSDGKPITRRSENSWDKTSTACESAGSSYCGTTTNPLAM